MYSATLLAGLSLFIFVLKLLMIWSKTNFATNPVWAVISFLNSCLLYPWFLWGGYRFSESMREKKLESLCELKKAHDLELQRERSKRHEIERKLESASAELKRQRVEHLSEIRSLRSSLTKESRTASDANDQALRSLL